MNNENRDLVILLHGILRTPIDMWPLSRKLEHSGYDTINILYPSRSKSLEDLTEYVDAKIRKSSKFGAEKKIHFVTHSMGSLIARYYIATKKPETLGKVVMLGPPNTGSEVADYLNGHKIFGGIYKWFYGPAGQQLVTGYRHADVINFPLGVIAGSKSVNPLAFLALKGEHDGIVPVERTRIEGMADHIVMPVTHSFMMFDSSVMAQVENFLKEGKFRR